MLANCIRFCDDGTLRGPDNYVIARCDETGWQVGGRLHREIDCEGPARLRVMLGEHDAPVVLGLYRQLHTAGGILYGDGASLNLIVPGRRTLGAGRCHRLTLSYEGFRDGKD